MMARKYRTLDEYMVETLAEPQEARAYLELAIEEYQEDKDLGAFLIALRHVVNAQGGIGKLAKATGLARSNLYDMLSDKECKPGFDTIVTIINALNFKLDTVSEYHPVQ